MTSYSFHLAESGDGTRIKIEPARYLSEDFKESLLISKRVAEKLTGRLFERDIVMEMEEPSMNGSSGSLMRTLALMSLLTGISLNQRMTGSGGVDAEGNILPILRLEEKARAAKNTGFTSFLLAKGQTVDRTCGITFYFVNDVAEAWRLASGICINCVIGLHDERGSK